MAVKRVVGWVLGPVLNPIWVHVSRSLLRDTEHAGKGLVHVAASEHLDGVSGALFADFAGGSTREAGCKRAASECGREKLPKSLLSEDSDAETAELWDAAMAALKPWLDEGR